MRRGSQEKLVIYYKITIVSVDNFCVVRTVSTVAYCVAIQDKTGVKMKLIILPSQSFDLIPQNFAADFGPVLVQDSTRLSH